MELQEAVRTPIASSKSGAAALVAADPGDPAQECVVGELIWTSQLCDDLPCQCEWGYNGVASDGLTMIAEVRRLPRIDRSTLQSTIAGRMRSHGYPSGLAAARADSLLQVADVLPVGTLLRLEHGKPVPFPPGAKLAGRSRVVLPAQRAVSYPSPTVILPVPGEE